MTSKLGFTFSPEITSTSLHFNDTNASTVVQYDQDTYSLINTTKDSNGQDGGGSYDELREVLRYVYMSWGDVFISVCVLGVLANSLALLVWCGEKAYNATTFLFKYLAVCDNVYLAVFGAFVACVQRKVNANPIVFVANAAQLLSAHTTLLVAITRWLAVFKPLHARVLLDPRRVIAACVALLVWCLLLESVHVVMEYGRVELSESIEMTAIYSKMVVGLVLPLLLLLGFNVALVWTAYRRRQASSGLGRRGQGGQSSGRVTLAVVCMSVTCLLAYPVGIVVQLLEAFLCFGPDQSHSCNVSVFSDLYVATILLQIINSSVNIVYYCAFASHFRQLLTERVNYCRTRRSAADETFTSGGGNTAAPGLAQS